MSLTQTYLTEGDLQNGNSRPEAAFVGEGDRKCLTFFLTPISVD